jgi:7,8-dihydroneopterin aldolase/epimerase/oxygenase
MSRVIIRNIEFQGRHGASADERKSARRFQVDVEMTFDMSRAIESDRLSDTVNYHEVCALVSELGSARPHRLLEALAAAMLTAICERWPEAEVRLELRKLHPPCPGNPSYTAVELTSGK